MVRKRESRRLPQELESRYFLVSFSHHNHKYTSHKWLGLPRSQPNRRSSNGSHGSGSHWRQNSVPFRTEHGGFYSFGVKGALDIFVIKDGTCYGIEVIRNELARNPLISVLQLQNVFKERGAGTAEGNRSAGTISPSLSAS